MYVLRLQQLRASALDPFQPTGPQWTEFKAPHERVAERRVAPKLAASFGSADVGVQVKCAMTPIRTTCRLVWAPDTTEKGWCESSLTGGVGADVDDVALGPVHLVLVGRRQLGLHHDGVLRPRLERQDEVTRFDLLLLTLGGSPGRVHICYHPAVGAAGVLPVKLGHILERSLVEN